MQQLRIDVWSDLACPWCYVGKRRLEAALEQFPHADAVQLVWRSFELDPAAPQTSEPDPRATRIARKLGTSEAQAQAMMQRMTEMAAQDGLDFHFERARASNTFDAHRLLHLAHTHGLQDALKERLFRAYLSEGELLGDPEVLTRLAVEVGLDEAEVRHTLTTDAFTRDVRDEQETARRLGIRGVPFFVFDGRQAVSGAQPADTLLAALQAAWDAGPGRETADTADTSAAAENPSCGPDGCA